MRKPAIRTVHRKSGHKYQIFREHRGLQHKLPFIDPRQLDAALRAKGSIVTMIAKLAVDNTGKALEVASSVRELIAEVETDGTV